MPKKTNSEMIVSVTKNSNISDHQELAGIVDDSVVMA